MQQVKKWRDDVCCCKKKTWSERAREAAKNGGARLRRIVNYWNDASFFVFIVSRELLYDVATPCTSVMYNQCI